MRLRVVGAGLRAVLELPLFILYVAVLAATGKGLHEALLELNARPSLAAGLRTFSKLASTYVRIHASNLEVLSSLRRLAEVAPDARVAGFIRGYVATRLSRGSVVDFVERSLQRALNYVDSTLRQRLDVAGGIMEALVLLSSVVAFSLMVVPVSPTHLYLLVVTVSALCVTTSVVLRLRVFEVYVLQPRLRELVLTLAAGAAALASLYDEGVRGAALAAAAVAADAALIYTNLSALKRMSSFIRSLRTLFEAIQLGTETIALHLSHGLPEELRYVIRTGRAPPARLQGMAMVLTHVLAEALRGGSRAARAAMLVTEFLEAVNDKFSMLVRYGVLYEALMAVVYVVLIASYAVASSMLASAPLTALPQSLVPPDAVARVLATTVVVGCVSVGILVWGNGASFALPIVILASKLGPQLTSLVALAPWLPA